VKNIAFAVNHVDTFVRSGAYKTHTPFPFVIGRDLVGTVAAIGAGVTAFRPGDPVWCNSLGHDGRQGSFAEYAVVPSERLYLLPETVNPLDAVGVLHTAATAHIGLFREAKIKPGETIFVAGAAGGVGSAVVQMASVAGARVIASASARDVQWVLSCGADEVIDYRDPQLWTRIADAAPEGVDIWWDNSGNHYFETLLPLLRKGARVIVMAGLGAQPSLPVGALYTRDVSLHGFAISNASAGDLTAAADMINHLLRSKRLGGRVGLTLPLSDTAQAHFKMEDHAPPGRIVVVP
jgi:NADPH:quinone reductase-like Zn-dependent oxidoreductase